MYSLTLPDKLIKGQKVAQVKQGDVPQGSIIIAFWTHLQSSKPKQILPINSETLKASQQHLSNIGWPKKLCKIFQIHPLFV